jgi:hypothetical protein
MTVRTNRNGTGPRHRAEVEEALHVIAAPNTPPPLVVPAPNERHLQSLEKKLQLVRDYTTRVALGFAPGLFVWGSGGIGKSYTVVRRLDELEANHQLLNSRVTGWGLICHLEQYPSQVTLIEDAESMYRDPRAIGVLRSALDCQRREGDKGPIERWVTWAGDSSAKKTKRVLFSGGIIILSNSELPPKPEVEALKTRMPCVHLTATDEELRALMRSVSAKGYSLSGHTMTPVECGQVCSYIEDQVHMLRSPQNMRLLMNGYAAYIQWACGQSGAHWHDMIRGEIREQALQVFTHPVAIQKPRGRDERKAEHQGIVREILGLTPDREERLKMWHERTGLAQSAFYARKAEVESE